MSAVYASQPPRRVAALDYFAQHFWTADVRITALIKSPPRLDVAGQADARALADGARVPRRRREPKRTGVCTNPDHSSCPRSTRIASVSRPGPLAKSVMRVVPRECCINSIPSSGSSARKRTPPPTPRNSLMTFSMNEDPYVK